MYFTILLTLFCILFGSHPVQAIERSAEWTFNKSFDDISGNGHDLTPFGNVYFNMDTPVHEEENYCLTIPPGAYLIAEDGYKGPAKNFTVELLFKTSMTKEGLIAATHDRTANQKLTSGGWHILIHSDGSLSIGVLLFDEETKAELISSPGFNDGQWHHVAFSISDANYLRAYIDGELYGETFTYGVSFDRNPIVLGRFPSDPDSGFYGSIDNVRVSSGTLDSDNLMAETVARITEPWTLLLVGMALLGIVYRLVASESSYV